MSKIKKRFIQLGAFFGVVFMPFVANAFLISFLVGAAIVAAGAGIAYLLWPENGTFTKIMNAFQSINGGCWFCSIFATLFAAINNLATLLYSTLATDCARLLELGMLFYILFKVLKALISFGEIDPKQFFTELFMPIVKGMVALIVVLNLSSFYGSVVNPLAELSIGFATEISSSGQSAGLGSFYQINSSGGTTTQTEVCMPVTEDTSQDAVFGMGVNNAIQCFLKTVSLSLIQYMALGATFIGDSFKMGWKVFPHWSMLGVGIFLFIGTFAIFLSFPFKLVDAMFRLMFVAALMPMWVLLWVLPATREYSQKAFKMFLNVLVTFICMSVILLMVLTILTAALGDLANNSEFWQELMDGETKDALEMIDWSTGTFFTMVAMTFLAFSLVGKTEEFVNQFAGDGMSLGMGGALQATAMAGAGLVGSKVAKPVLQKSVGAATKAIKKTPYAAGFVAGRIKSGKPLRWSDIPGSGLVKKTAQAYREGVSEGYGKPLDSKGANKTPGGNTPPGGNGGGGNPPPPTGNKPENGAPTEAAKKAIADLGTGNTKGLEELLKNPANIGAVISAVTGGAISPDIAAKVVKSVASASNEVLPNGNSKETRVTRGSNEDGKVVQEKIDTIIRDRLGNVLSKTTRHELFNPETKASGAIEIERDVSDKIVSFIKEVKDENGRLIQQLKTDVKTGKTTDMLNHS